jgi:hypothetical protein
MIHVTEHAIDRYCERFAPVGREIARRRITSSAGSSKPRQAFGAHTVRIGNGAKLVIRGSSPVRVITVLDRRQIKRGRLSASAVESSAAAPAACAPATLSLAAAPAPTVA